MNSKKQRKPFSSNEILLDYRLAYESRQVSLIGRREVLSGKAKFGIFGDGKELPNIAMAKYFRNGDFRSGYYRDQTFMFATGELSPVQFFSQLYADSNLENEPASAGRSMNAHFSTRSLDEQGEWKNLLEIKNSAADLSPTGSQMAKLVGLAYASKLYRELEEIQTISNFSQNGNEVAFGTIGNASCAEGIFWESVNAIGVLQVPAVISIWDDSFGISVSNQLQLTDDLSKILSGFQKSIKKNNGFDLYRVSAWDYEELLDTYFEATHQAREKHIPSIIHVIDVTQPQGHSTSGSHERYKEKDRLEWEKENDCLLRFRNWIIEQGISSNEVLTELETEETKQVEEYRQLAFSKLTDSIQKDFDEFLSILNVDDSEKLPDEINLIISELQSKPVLSRQDIHEAAFNSILILEKFKSKAFLNLKHWRKNYDEFRRNTYDSHLISQSKYASKNIKEEKAIFSQDSITLNGFQIVNKAFDSILNKHSNVIAFGEDVGKLGGVNQGFAGLQEKYGELRVIDTGIREATILGQAIGLAMRGFRPIAEIQYLDYLLYALQMISDDLATLHWRTKGGQKAPVIIRTRGHRLEGIWHSGSLMGGLLNNIRGVNLLVPRNMVQAVGFYNTLLASDEPGIVIEPLNAYRLKEKLPDNYETFKIPLGLPEFIRTGHDITVVTYGPLVRIATIAAEYLSQFGIEIEIIDVQSLLPFDLNGLISRSLEKTNRILFLDEDVPGGSSAYMMQEVLEGQGGYHFLDSPPRTLTGTSHRPAYGSDGNYWSKPNTESIIMAILEIMNEVDPIKYPNIFEEDKK